MIFWTQTFLNSGKCSEKTLSLDIDIFFTEREIEKERERQKERYRDTGRIYESKKKIKIEKKQRQ